MANVKNFEGNEEWITGSEHEDPDIMPKLPGWCILIRPVEAEKKTKGGILLPDQSHDAVQYLTTIGKVVMLGDEAYKDRDEAWCKLGDHVIYQRFAGTKLLWGGVRYLILNDDEVIATTDNPEYLDPNFNLASSV